LITSRLVLLVEPFHALCFLHVDFLEDHDWIDFASFNDIRCGIDHISTICGRYLSCLSFAGNIFDVSLGATFNSRWLLLFILLLDECLVNVLEDWDGVLEFAIVLTSLKHVFDSLGVHFEICDEWFGLAKG
jgi:hypothetical protein